MAAAMSEDLLVFDDVATHHYVAYVDEQWWRWPAERGGWRDRKRVGAGYVAACYELAPANAVLALKLSGVPS
jgi:hypothetical protein